MKKFKKLMLERIKWRMPGKGKSAADAEENRCDLVWQVYDVTFLKNGRWGSNKFFPRVRIEIGILLIGKSNR